MTARGCRHYIGSIGRIARRTCRPACWRLACMVRLFGAREKGFMLFNSYLFIFVFLPVVLVGYFALGRRSNLAPVVWLALASFGFYAFSGGQFVLLLSGSIAVNYGVGYLLIARKL